MTDNTDLAPPVEPDPVEPAPVEPNPAPTPEPVANDPPPSNAGMPSWALKRISEESAKAREAQERAAAAERKAAEAAELAQRLIAAGDRQGREGIRPVLPAPDETARRAEIQQAAAAQRFYEDTADVRNKGFAEFGPSFGETLNALGALGATSDDFIADVLATDKSGAHALLKKIASDPDKAVALTQMNSRQRIAELTRMSIASTAASPDPAVPAATAPATRRTVSSAPAPAPRIEPTTTKVKDWRMDDASEEEFTAGFNEMMEKRLARR